MRDAKELVQGLTRHNFYQTSKDIDSQAVFPTITRIEEERNARQSLHAIFNSAVIGQ